MTPMHVGFGRTKRNTSGMAYLRATNTAGLGRVGGRGELAKPVQTKHIIEPQEATRGSWHRY